MQNHPLIQPRIARFHSNFLDFDHVSFDVPRTFKINGSKINLTAQRNVSASKTV